MKTLEDFETLLERAIRHITQVAFNDEVERDRKAAFHQLAALLMHLAGTAKPEAAPCHHEKIKATSPTTGCCCHHRAEDWTELYDRAIKAEARVKELEDENKAMRDAVAENNELGSENIDLGTRVRELEAALQAARANAAREERERILKVLLATKLTDVYSFCDKYHGDGWVKGALIALLEPKP